MKLVGLGGGIGAGKSTVSTALAERGAVIVDADLIARQVVEPGTPTLAALVERFGPTVRREDGTLDRAALAAMAFVDAESIAALNAITHPAIGAEINRLIAAQRDIDRVVILDAALLFDRARPGLVGSIVVDVDPEVAIARLVEFRGFDEIDARRRVTAQMKREDRVALADQVIDNSGDRDDLAPQLDRIWEWIATLPHSELPE
jgi:dephospho-CoA kinase